MFIDQAISVSVPDLQGALREVKDNLDHWDKVKQMERIISTRKLLNSRIDWNNTHSARELVFADILLEQNFR